MTKYKEPSAGPGKEVVKKGKLPEQEVNEEQEENCRCKEVAKKTPREMLRLMISDVAFWKKGKGRKSDP